MKKIVILGSTGSIGDSALKIVRSYRKEFKVAALATGSNIKKLAEQVREFKPEMVAISDEESYRTFRDWGDFPKGMKILGGPGALKEAAVMDGADLVLSGVVGAVGLVPLIAAIKKGRTVALANKEALVMAGDLVMRSAVKHRAVILPVDSEHSAMFQCIQGQSSNEIHKILLTASGGAFYRYDGDLSKVTVEKALAHPNWVMGKKITVDSATLMNKGLETIEAHYLFNVPYAKIQTVVHRQSIIHSAVEFADGSIIAQLSVPDMCIPIQYAMTYPERKPCPVRRLDLIEASRLDFEAPDFKKFPCLELALEAGRKGGTMPAALSAANEVAVNAFLKRRIRFTDISKVVEKAVSKHRVLKEPDLDGIIGVDAWARAVAEEAVGRIG